MLGTVLFLPLLLNRLPCDYWWHFSLYVNSLHLLLKSSITTSEIDAAEQMLLDFYALMPELYGVKFCTHNVHLLSHSPKFGRLFGPLWTTSLFGYESKHRHFKQLFHGNDDIYHQIIDNIDASLTMQLMSQYFPSEDDTSRGRNMKQLSDYCYTIGCTKMIVLSDEQRNGIGSDYRHSHTAFFRLYKRGTIFYSSGYIKDRMYKRENTFFSFIEDGAICYGQIIMFLIDPSPVALIMRCNICDVSLKLSAGDPSKPILQTYKEVDLLSTIVVPVTLSSTLTAVNIENILSKSVVVRSRGNPLIYVISPTFMNITDFEFVII